MKYFIDTEFIEGFHKPLFGKRRHFIDLISIGIVCEDGRSYYAISTEFNPKDADRWVKDNVIAKLPPKNEYKISFRGGYNQKFDLYKSNKQIAEEIKNFCYVLKPNTNTSNPLANSRIPDNPEFYAYYADYDWVVFCSLFGRMIDLPKGFPMYCRDLKQMFDEQIETFYYPESVKCMKGTGEEVTLKITAEKIKALPNYPKQQNKHSALDDAKWNFELYKFLKGI